MASLAAIVKQMPIITTLPRANKLLDVMKEIGTGAPVSVPQAP